MYRVWTAEEVRKNRKLWKIGDGQPSEIDISPYPGGKDVAMVWREDTYSKHHPWVKVYNGQGKYVGRLKIDSSDYARNGYFYFRRTTGVVIPMYFYTYKSKKPSRKRRQAAGAITSSNTGKDYVNFSWTNGGCPANTKFERQKGFFKSNKCKCQAGQSQIKTTLDLSHHPVSLGQYGRKNVTSYFTDPRYGVTPFQEACQRRNGRFEISSDSTWSCTYCGGLGEAFLRRSAGDR